MAEIQSNQVFNPDTAGQSTNTAATPPVYVIIGNSFAACVNHATLRWSDEGKKRLARADVIHIFERDPWSTYVTHDMGQWTDLLILPGFTFIPTHASNDYLVSWKFANATSSQFSDLSKRYQFRSVVGHVTKIEKKKNKFSITVDTGKKPIIADFVDVCPGPGAPRLTEETTKKKVAYDFKQRGVLFDKALRKEYESPSPTGRVLSAHAYMNNQANRRGGSVCIFGVGPLAGSCVEQAIAAGCNAIYWVGKDPVNASFAPGLRYDHLAHTTDGKELPRRLGPLANSVVLNPFDKKLKIGEGFKLAEIRTTRKKRTAEFSSTDGDPSVEDSSTTAEPLATGDADADAQASKNSLIEVSFAPGVPDSRSARRFVDLAKPKAKDIKSIVVDQIIISASNQDRDNETGAPAYLVKDVRSSEAGGKFTAIKPPAPRMKVTGIQQVTVGVQTANGAFRLLGTAGLTHADRIAEEQGGRASRLVLYENSLPDQAHVNRVGVTISAAAIAQANGFFQKHPNDCVNIAHSGELVTVFGIENGNLIFKARSQRIDPFTDKASSPDDRDHPLPRVGNSNYHYRPPLDYWM